MPSKYCELFTFVQGKRGPLGSHSPSGNPSVWFFPRAEVARASYQLGTKGFAECLMHGVKTLAAPLGLGHRFQDKNHGAKPRRTAKLLTKTFWTPPKRGWLC